MWNNLYKPSSRMRQSILKLAIKKHRNQFLQHSGFLSNNTWATIKEAEANAPNDKTLRRIMYELKVALKEAEVPDISKNEKLAQAVAGAKKNNLPTFLIEKLIQEKKREMDRFLVEIAGPSDILALIHMEAVNKAVGTTLLRQKLKKLGWQIVHDRSVIKWFESVHAIVCKRDCTLDEAVEDGIEVGANSVEQIERSNEKYFQFTVEPHLALKCEKLLISLNYDVPFSDVIHEPKRPLEMDKKTEAVLRVFEQATKNVPNVRRMEHNVE